MKRYEAKRITNKEHKAYGMWGVIYKAQGKEYCVSYGDTVMAFDTEAEAREKALIERMLDHQKEMDNISDKLCKEHGYTRDNFGDKCIGDILA